MNRPAVTGLIQSGFRSSCVRRFVGLAPPLSARWPEPTHCSAAKPRGD